VNLKKVKAVKEASDGLDEILEKFIAEDPEGKVKETILDLVDHHPLDAQPFVEGMGALHRQTSVRPGIWQALVKWYARWSAPNNPDGIHFATSGSKKSSAPVEDKLDNMLKAHIATESNRAAVRSLMMARPIDRNPVIKVVAALQASGGCSVKLMPALVEYMQQAPSATPEKHDGIGKVVKGNFPKHDEKAKPKDDTEIVSSALLNRADLIVSTPSELRAAAPAIPLAFERQYKRKGPKFAIHSVLKAAEGPIRVAEILVKAREVTTEKVEPLAVVQFLEKMASGDSVRFGWALDVTTDTGKTLFRAVTIEKPKPDVKKNGKNGK
jgi:hypothetical protein